MPRRRKPRLRVETRPQKSQNHTGSLRAERVLALQIVASSSGLLTRRVFLP